MVEPNPLLDLGHCQGTSGNQPYRCETRTRGRPKSKHGNASRECPWREIDDSRRERGRKVCVEFERGAHPPGGGTLRGCPAGLERDDRSEAFDDRPLSRDAGCRPGGELRARPWDPTVGARRRPRRLRDRDLRGRPGRGPILDERGASRSRSADRHGGRRRDLAGSGPVHPVDRAGDVLRHYQKFMEGAPDELQAYGAFLFGPDGSPVVAIVPAWIGPVEEGLRVLRPLREFGPPIADLVQEIAYTDHRAIF